LFLEEICPIILPKKESPILNPFDGTDKVPTPVPTILVSVVVFVTVEPLLVCENNPYTKGYGKDGEVPLVPAVPAAPAVPLDADVPAVPAIPLVPFIPDVPFAPEVPDVPTTPLVPDVPDKPAAPLVPEVPVPPPPPALYATPFIASNCLEICHKRFSSVPHPICLLGIAMIEKINAQRYVTFYY
jgi:hypothetical protein